MASNSFFVMVKPDGVLRGLVGAIIARFEQRGFRLENIKMCRPPKELVIKHYSELESKSFFQDLVDFTTSGLIVPMVWNGNIDVARNIVGVTVPWEAKMGTIRGDFSCNLPMNLVHCSDSPESAKREVELWFGSE